MNTNKILKEIAEDLQDNATPYEEFVYEPKMTHQIIRKHLGRITKHRELWEWILIWIAFWQIGNWVGWLIMIILK